MDQREIHRQPFKRRPANRSNTINNDRRKLGPSWLSLFKNTDEQAITDCLEHSDVLSLPAGTPLLQPGQANSFVYLLLSGRLVAHLDSSLNPDTAILIEPGECIGELSAIDDNPVSALVLAVTDVRILELTPATFWDKLMPLPGVAKNMLIALTERMRRTNQTALQAQRKQLALQYLQQELNVAKRLQADMLPLRKPLFPERLDIEVAGMMEPATEIGGDLFDVFFVDDHLLFIGIGDVSGHGIPAALFMARTIGLIHIAAMVTTQPHHLLERINNQLCEGNDANMFVTLFCGFLDLKTGRLTYSNAGHCPPLHVTDEQRRHLPIPKGTAAGIIPGIFYSTNEIILNEDETLLCYTDGVSEAQDQHEKEYSAERLLNLVNAYNKHPLEELLQVVCKNVSDYTQKKELADDCTMLAIRRIAANQ